MPEEVTNEVKPKSGVTVITSAVAREKYPVRKGYKTANGGAVRDSGDAVAVALRGKGIDDWLALADANGRGENLRKVAADHPNNLGMVRMALGTILRAAIKRHNDAEDKSKAPYPILKLGGEPGSQPEPATSPQPTTNGDDDDEIAEDDDSEEFDPEDQPESSNAV